MDIKKIIREEMDDFQWIHDIKPTPKKLEEIPHFYGMKFSIYRLEDNTQLEDPKVDDNIYWLDEIDSNMVYENDVHNVCWKDVDLKCVNYSGDEIIKLFNHDHEYWLWKFI